MTTQKEKLNNIQSSIDWHCENNFNKDYHKAVNKLIKEVSKNDKFVEISFKKCYAIKSKFKKNVLIIY